MLHRGKYIWTPVNGDTLTAKNCYIDNDNISDNSKEIPIFAEHFLCFMHSYFPTWVYLCIYSNNLMIQIFISLLQRSTTLTFTQLVNGKAVI